MEFNGRYTYGEACLPRTCAAGQVRFVFSAGDVWVAFVSGERVRIYGDPPPAARILLLRERNEVARRGPTEEPSRLTYIPPITRPPVTRLAYLPPVPLPVSTRATEPPMRAQPDVLATEIPMRKHDGTFLVPALLNNTLTVNFMIDSGASDVSVSPAVVEKLLRSGTLDRSDFRGKQTYRLADGSSVTNDTFRLRVLKVGDREIRDVFCSVSTDDGGLLLGQTFLQRFRSWSIDNQRQVLVLK